MHAGNARANSTGGVWSLMNWPTSSVGFMVAGIMRSLCRFAPPLWFQVARLALFGMLTAERLYVWFQPTPQGFESVTIKQALHSAK
jgi:hypothetical protein